MVFKDIVEQVLLKLIEHNWHPIALTVLFLFLNTYIDQHIRWGGASSDFLKYPLFEYNLIQYMCFTGVHDPTNTF